MDLIRKGLRILTEPGEISLGHYLLFALAVRIPAVFFSRGFEFIDHQFAYVDPAYMLAFDGSWYHHYDYVEGNRSWAYPGFLAAVFTAISRLGITEAGAMMTATRFVHALFSLIPVAAFWTLVVRWKGLAGQRPLLLFTAYCPLAVYAGVQPTGITFAVGLSLTAIFLFHGTRPIWPALSGLLVGLAFACRFQDGIFGVVLFAAGLLQRRWRDTAWLCAGAVVGVAIQGVIDLLTWGTFLHSPLAYLRINFVAGEAFVAGDSPWMYLYGGLAMAVLVPPFLRSGFRALAAGTREFPILLAASLVYLGVHFAIPRHRFRFIIPAVILLLLVYVAGLLRSGPDQPRFRPLHQRLVIGIQLVLLVFASFWYFHRGPVEAARELSRRPDFQDRVVIVNQLQEQIGGHFYLQRKSLAVLEHSPQSLVTWLEAEQPPMPLYLMVCERPLPDGAIPAPWKVEEAGSFTDLLDLKKRSRRYLYRVDR